MLRKKLQRIGNSVGIILPKDVVEAADLREGAEVTITLHGHRIVLEPSIRAASDEEFQSAWEAVLRRHGDAFRKMAEHDRGSRRRHGR